MWAYEHVDIACRSCFVKERLDRSSHLIRTDLMWALQFRSDEMGWNKRCEHAAVQVRSDSSSHCPSLSESLSGNSTSISTSTLSVSSSSSIVTVLSRNFCSLERKDWFAEDCRGQVIGVETTERRRRRTWLTPNSSTTVSSTYTSLLLFEPTRNKALVHSTTHPCCAAHRILLLKNMHNAPLTSSTKPEVHNVSQRRQRRTEPRQQATCTKNLV